jgi:hypothetical protein
MLWLCAMRLVMDGNKNFKYVLSEIVKAYKERMIRKQ